MADHWPLNLEPSAADRRRWLVGVSINCRHQEVRAALVACEGRSLDCRAEIAAVTSVPVARQARRLWRRVVRGRGNHPAEAAALATQLAEIQAMAVDQLASQAPRAWDRVLAVGVADPGLWRRDPLGPPAYLSLCDAALLADLTGLNVIDAFPARDLAQGGRGGPLMALPFWSLLRDAKKPRLVVEVEPSLRATYLPPARDAAGAGRVAALELGPGARFIRHLEAQFTGADDETGTSQCGPPVETIPHLLEYWLSHPEFDRVRAWRPNGQSPQGLVTGGLRLAAEAGWRLPEVLATARRLMAELIAQAIATRLPQSPPLAEVIVAGDGSDGALRSEIAERLPAVAVLSETEIGIPAGSLEPAAVALLALLHLDQTPANPTALTGARTPRILGRLTPGSPQVWRRLINEIADNKSAVLSLRSAI